MNNKEKNIQLQIELTKLQMEKNEKKHQMQMERLEKKKEIAELNLIKRR